MRTEFRIVATVYDHAGAPYAWTWLYLPRDDGGLAHVPTESAKTVRLPYAIFDAVGDARREWNRLAEGAWLPSWAPRGTVSGVRQWRHSGGWQMVTDSIVGTHDLDVGHWPGRRVDGDVRALAAAQAGVPPAPTDVLEVSP